MKDKRKKPKIRIIFGKIFNKYAIVGGTKVEGKDLIVDAALYKYGFFSLGLLLVSNLQLSKRTGEDETGYQLGENDEIPREPKGKGMGQATSFQRVNSKLRSHNILMIIQNALRLLDDDFDD